MTSEGVIAVDYLKAHPSSLAVLDDIADETGFLCLFGAAVRRYSGSLDREQRASTRTASMAKRVRVAGHRTK